MNAGEKEGEANGGLGNARPTPSIDLSIVEKPREVGFSALTKCLVMSEIDGAIRSEKRGARERIKPTIVLYFSFDIKFFTTD